MKLRLPKQTLNLYSRCQLSLFSHAVRVGTKTYTVSTPTNHTTPDGLRTNFPKSYEAIRRTTTAASQTTSNTGE